MSNQVEQTKFSERPDGDRYTEGYMDGKKFAEDRAANLERLHGNSESPVMVNDGWRMEAPMVVHIDRRVYHKANGLWQDHTKNLNTFMTPEQLLRWLTIRIPELETYSRQAKAEGLIKGFNDGHAKGKIKGYFDGYNDPRSVHNSEVQ